MTKRRIHPLPDRTIPPTARPAPREVGPDMVQLGRSAKLGKVPKGLTDPQLVEHTLTRLNIPRSLLCHAIGRGYRTVQRWHVGDAPIPKFLRHRLRAMRSVILSDEALVVTYARSELPQLRIRNGERAPKALRKIPDARIVSIPHPDEDDIPCY